MKRFKLRPYLHWTGESPTLKDISGAAALGSYVLTPGQKVRCWICYRSSMVSWGRMVSCVGDGSCHSYYALLPISIDERSLGIAINRIPCRKCNSTMFMFKSNEGKCLRCKTFVMLDPKITATVLLCSPANRKLLKDNGILGPKGGPSWKDSLIPNFWQPRVIHSRKDEIIKYSLYRKRELDKAAIGRDVFKDYRKFREDM